MANRGKKEDFTAMALEIGEALNIPCEVSDGAFPGEHLVTVDTALGPVSGFVQAADVHYSSADNPYIVGIIEDFEGDTVVVRLKGSFFRTTGLTYLHKASVLATT